MFKKDMPRPLLAAKEPENQWLEDDSFPFGARPMAYFLY